MRDLLGNKFLGEEDDNRKSFKAHSGPFDKQYVRLAHNGLATGTLVFSVSSYKSGEKGSYHLNRLQGLIWVPQA